MKTGIMNKDGYFAAGCVTQSFRKFRPEGLNRYIHFLSVAKGSLAELDTQRILSYELGYTDKDMCNSIDSDINELQRMLHSLIEKLTNKITNH